MDSSQFIEEKPVGAMGRVVIPDPLRESCNMEEGTRVKFFKTPENDVLIVSSEKSDKIPEPLIMKLKCDYCGCVKNGYELKEHRCCLSCLKVFIRGTEA